jgi:hypothetical protein
MFGELDDLDIYVNNQGDNFDDTPVPASDFEKEVNERLASDEQPVYNQPDNQPVKKSPASGFFVILLLLIVLAGGVFAYKKFVKPEAPAEEQSAGDMFYDQAAALSQNNEQKNGQNTQAATNNEPTATVDVVLEQNTAPQKPEQKPAQEVAKTVQQEEKPVSAFEKVKKKADETKKAEKNVTIAVSNGGRVDPFLPYDSVGGNTSAKFDLIAPPMDIPDTSDDVLDEMMSVKISGIMYEQTRPSAIINFDGSDQLVHRGDVLKGYKIVDITKNSVVIKYGTNVYQATVGQSLDQGINLNPVSDLSKQFGGAYNGTAKKAIQIN